MNIFERSAQFWRIFLLKNQLAPVIEPTERRTRRALEKGEKYCPLSEIEVKKKVVKTQNKKNIS